MKIAVTRIAGKEKTDAARCAAFGHTCFSVHPLRSELRHQAIAGFLEAVGRGEFDAIFFTSALPAKIIAPSLRVFPRVIAIGPQTAMELRRYNIPCEVLPTFYSRDFVPFLGEWIRGKRIGIPRADVPNPGLIDAITAAGGSPVEFRCYGLESTGLELDLTDAGAILFTSTRSFEQAVWKPHPGLLVLAIGEITASAMQARDIPPVVTGDGSLEGTLRALNTYLEEKKQP